MELINFLIERYYLSLPLLIVIFLLIYSSSTKGGKKISPQFLISLANNENAFIVDLRNSELFNQGHITGSINIPFNNLSKDLTRYLKITNQLYWYVIWEMFHLMPENFLKKRDTKIY